MRKKCDGRDSKKFVEYVSSDEKQKLPFATWQAVLGKLPEEWEELMTASLYI